MAEAALTVSTSSIPPQASRNASCGTPSFEWKTVCSAHQVQARGRAASGVVLQTLGERLGVECRGLEEPLALRAAGLQQELPLGLALHALGDGAQHVYGAGERA